MLTRLGPPLTIFLLAGPILAGLTDTILPAFGYLPALGGTALTLAPLAELADSRDSVRLVRHRLCTSTPTGRR